MEQNKLEQQEAASLVDKGVSFKIGKRAYVMKELCGGTLDLISEVSLHIQLDDDKLKENPIGESKEIGKKATKKLALILAYAILNNKWKIRFFAPFLARKILWKFTPSQLLKAAVVLTEMCNYADFINSIRLIAGVRTTKPNLIEEEPKA